MDELARNLYYIGIFFYLLALIFSIFTNEDNIKKQFSYLILTGFVFHLTSLLFYTCLCGYIPIHKRVQNTLVRTFGMAVVLNYIFFKYKDKLLSKIIILSILMVFISGLPFSLPSEMIIKDVFLGFAPFFWFHLYDISFVIFSYCFCLSIKGLILINKGKNDFYYTLKPRIHNAAFFGFTIFTLGQIAGSVWAMIDFGDYWHWKPMHLLSVSTWMFYAAMVHLKWIKEIPRKTLPLMGIIGFAGLFWWTIYHDFAKQIVAFIKGGITWRIKKILLFTLLWKN